MVEKNNSKLITILLAIIIIIAIIALVYVNLPDENNDKNNDIIPVEEQILTIIYKSQETNFTISNLETLGAYSGNGSYLKIGALPDIIIDGPFNFTGVKFSTLISQIESLPENYNITVTASDGWTNEFTKDQINGKIEMYNETGEIIEEGNVTMILAYIEDNEYINKEDGSLRIAFIGKNVITASNLWSKAVEIIEIVEV